jgi:D-arabinose 5-phosphate isomerase GutQ
MLGLFFGPGHAQTAHLPMILPADHCCLADLHGESGAIVILSRSVKRMKQDIE